MTHCLRIPASLLLALAVAAPAAAQSGGVKLPPYKKVRLTNGLTLVLMEQHEVPIVSLSAIVRAGSTADPAGKEGLASITAGLLRRGTRTRTAEQFAAELDFIGASLGAGASVDAISLDAEFLKKDLAKGLDLVTDALLRPAFVDEEVVKLVRQRVDGIKAAKDQAQGVLGSYYNAYLYGRHPYGRPVGGTEISVASIARLDVARFYETHVVPANTTVAVVGDFVTADMEKRLTDLWGAWPARPAPAPVVLPDLPASTGRRLLLVDKPDSPQTYFRIGNVGIARTNPDRVAIEVVNTLFGGRFTSMLNSELRIKSGLTYGAGSTFSEWKARGPFAISSYTPNATTEKALDLALDVLKRLHDKGITEEELKSVKAYLTGQFPPEVETSDQLASILTSLDFYGLADADVNAYCSRIEAVTMADVRRVIAQYFPLDALVFTVIGKAAEIEPILKKYAPVLDRRSIAAPGFF